MANSTFKKYTHIEESVEAIQLTVDTQSKIVSALAAEAEIRLLKSLEIEYNSAVGHYEFSYRYQTETVPSNLKSGDYLVRLNAGNYAVYSAEEFESEYLNTSVDTQIPEADKKTPKQALVAFVNANYPDISVATEDDLTSVVLSQIAEQVNSWYDAEGNTMDIKFTDGSITDPSGLADIIKGFSNASYMNDDTTFTLNFNNGCFQEDDGNSKPNQFNYIALQMLVAEIRALGSKLANRITGISFRSMRDGSPSAIAASVTDAQWESFVNTVESLTAINSFNNVSR